MRRRVVQDSSWGLLDQALYSGSNVILTVVVARSVSEEDFGGFSLCYVVYMLMVGISRTTGSKPFTIQNSLDQDAVVRAETSRLFGYALGLGLLSGGACLVVSQFLSGPLQTGLVVLAALLPGLMLQDAVRGVFFARQRPILAFANDALWTVLQVAAIAGVLLAAEPPQMALLMAGWGVPASVAAVVGAVQIGARPRRPALVGWLRAHRQLAVPLAVNLLLTAAPSYLAYLAMPAVSSLEQLAVVRGAYVFFGPLNVVFTGVALMALPVLLRVTEDRRRRATYSLSAGLAGVAATWGLVVVLLPDSVGTALLGDLWNDTFSTRALLAVSLVAEGVLVAPETFLASVRLPRRMTAVRLAAAVVTFVSAVALAHATGAVGLAAGFALGYWVGAVLAVMQVKRTRVSTLALGDPATDPTG